MKKKGAIKAKKDIICLVNIGKSALERMQRKIVIRLKEEMQPSAIPVRYSH